MDDLYSFMDRYIQNDFEEEKVLKASPRGTVVKLRKKTSHQRYICRRYRGPADIYFNLLGKECPYLPKIFEVAQEQPGTAPNAGGAADAACAADETPAAAESRAPEGRKPEGDAQMRRVIVLEEYVEGDTLSMLLQAGPLNTRQVRNICVQLCRGLYVLHSLGWVHRDIKPENVMIHGSRAVLIDFDAARCYENIKDRDTRILGTVGYAPPEQYGISGTDYRADIYAMGVLINEMLTGEHPSQTLAGGRWGRIVTHCTMIHPEKRYASVKELMEAL